MDTWFSSWIWPIQVFDGLHKEEEVAYYYPTNDLVTRLKSCSSGWPA